MPLDGAGNETGWLSKWAFRVSALARDVIGRQAMEDGYVNDAKLELYNEDQRHAKRIARATYDFAEHGGAVSTIGLGVNLPDNAIVVRAWYEVITTCHSPATPDAATISIDIPVDDVAGILAAIAINDGTNPWDAGLFEAIQDGGVANFATKTTAEREISITIGIEPLDAGKFIVFCEYVVSD